MHETADGSALVFVNWSAAALGLIAEGDDYAEFSGLGGGDSDNPANVLAYVVARRYLREAWDSVELTASVDHVDTCAPDFLQDHRRTVGVSLASAEGWLEGESGNEYFREELVSALADEDITEKAGEALEAYVQETDWESVVQFARDTLGEYELESEKAGVERGQALEDCDIQLWFTYAVGVAEDDAAKVAPTFPVVDVEVVACDDVVTANPVTEKGKAWAVDRFGDAYAHSEDRDSVHAMLASLEDAGLRFSKGGDLS